ncbi:MAG TPA: hypothetical protein VLL52_13125 [Anaerolineae bacterium]|nr:hypothetical protein [Anaerolineae bacterium]
MKRLQWIFWGMVGVMMLVGCGGGEVATPTVGDSAAVVVESGDDMGSSSGALQVMVGSDDFAVGTPRVPLILFDGPDVAEDVQSVVVEIFKLVEGGEPELVGFGEARGYTDYKVPYWVAYPDFATAGNWGLGLTMERGDGSIVQGSVVVRVSEENNGPALGAVPPASENRTLADGWTVAELSSDPTLAEGLYAMTVAEALVSERPTVVTLATPAYCTSQLCSPVVESVEAMYEKIGSEQANFIHLEIYQEFDPLKVADEVEEWGLKTEPWTFVLDAEGRVTARFGGPLAVSELEAALKELGL